MIYAHHPTPHPPPHLPRHPRRPRLPRPRLRPHPRRIHRTPDGLAVHAEVRAGDATIWLHPVTPEHDLDSPRATDVANAGLVVQVDDVDAHYQTARAAGARIDADPIDQPYGQREYAARDPESHRWWFMMPVPVQR